ncbi:hypothetical protein EYF80_010737 [Liparis tanakae]|uniref:AV ZBD domain-containing protein n=1 Tax=Liparis tanakae TaxID=230148 RepID=A0A4Z2IMW3_9TELE|nr:hypothetical protein EYF80_010737 [Liparis tanakae]
MGLVLGKDHNKKAERCFSCCGSDLFPSLCDLHLCVLHLCVHHLCDHHLCDHHLCDHHLVVGAFAGAENVPAGKIKTSQFPQGVMEERRWEVWLGLIFRLTAFLPHPDANAKHSDLALIRWTPTSVNNGIQWVWLCPNKKGVEMREGREAKHEATVVLHAAMNTRWHGALARLKR